MISECTPTSQIWALIGCLFSSRRCVWADSFCIESGFLSLNSRLPITITSIQLFLGVDPPRGELKKVIFQGTNYYIYLKISVVIFIIFEILFHFKCYASVWIKAVLLEVYTRIFKIRCSRAEILSRENMKRHFFLQTPLERNKYSR